TDSDFPMSSIIGRANLLLTTSAGGGFQLRIIIQPMNTIHWLNKLMTYYFTHQFLLILLFLFHICFFDFF
ncbi:hypothetical protein KKJ04_07400, partial [Xenorhabdus bovienii]|nr:hypothetical protein [Xenorhabdus bovienii]